jgi:hypothetical protein
MSGLFAALFVHQRRRVRYQLRNRLMPLSILVDERTPLERRVRWSIFAVVVVVVLAVMAFGESGSRR